MSHIILYHYLLILDLKQEFEVCVLDLVVDDIGVTTLLKAPEETVRLRGVTERQAECNFATHTEYDN